MNRNSRSRAQKIALYSLTTFAGIACILFGLQKNINLFITPHYLIEHRESLQQQFIRLGGMVSTGSVHVIEGKVVFWAHEPEQPDTGVKVIFSGLPPALFKEGSAVIAEGQYRDGIVYASRILAKHDERYQPKATDKGTLGVG